MIIPHISNGQSTQFFFGYQHTLDSLGLQRHAAPRFPPSLKKAALAGVRPYADFGNLCTARLSMRTASAPRASQHDPQSVHQRALPVQPHSRPAPSIRPPSAYEKVFPTYLGSEAAGKIGNTVNYFKPTIQTLQRVHRPRRPRLRHQRPPLRPLLSTTGSHSRPSTIRQCCIATPRTSTPATRTRCSLKPTPSPTTCSTTWSSTISAKSPCAADLREARTSRPSA